MSVEDTSHFAGIVLPLQADSPGPIQAVEKVKILDSDMV